MGLPIMVQNSNNDVSSSSSAPIRLLFNSSFSYRVSFNVTTIRASDIIDNNNKKLSSDLKSAISIIISDYNHANNRRLFSFPDFLSIHNVSHLEVNDTSKCPINTNNNLNIQSCIFVTSYVYYYADILQKQAQAKID